MDATKQVKVFIKSKYEATFVTEFNEAVKVKNYKPEEAERFAQKEAIKTAILSTMKKYPNVEPAAIWRSIYEIHVHRKSGIEILLQRDLNTIIKAGELANEPRDISWLKEQIKGSVFDLYATYVEDSKRFCFGCIQSRTSIRDRVTRDREPSIAAMKSFFWSVVLVLDGDFLKMPKFKAMIDGGTAEYKENGWHGMYVFSNKYAGERIYPLHVDLSKFADHAVQAAQYWRTQRQWFNAEWKAE